MKFFKKNNLSDKEKRELHKLWNQEYPKDLYYDNIIEFEEYLAGLDDHFHILILDEAEKIIGWYFDFIREDERWFAMILDSEFQGKGLGKALLKIAKEERLELSGWVITSNDYLKFDGEPYTSPLGFYKKIGFRVYEDIKLQSWKISAIKIKWSLDH